MIKRKPIQTLARVLGTLLIIAGITAFYFFIFNQANSITIAMTFLLATLGVATAWGLLEAIIASVAGMLCFNFFFLPPIFTFSPADQQNCVALFVFLVTAVVASQLSTSVKQRALEATRRREEMERLYELSRDDKIRLPGTNQLHRVIDVLCEPDFGFEPLRDAELFDHPVDGRPARAFFSPRQAFGVQQFLLDRIGRADLGFCRTCNHADANTNAADLASAMSRKLAFLGEATEDICCQHCDVKRFIRFDLALYSGGRIELNHERPSDSSLPLGNQVLERRPHSV